ncbi:MAG: ATP-binding protein, partial [Hyphomonadaceae bacterium]
DAAASLWERVSRPLRLSIAARVAAIALFSAIILFFAGLAANALFNREIIRLLVDPQLSNMIDDVLELAQPSSDGNAIDVAQGYDSRFTQLGSGYYFQIARIDDGFHILRESQSLADVRLTLTPEQRTDLTAPGPDGFPVLRYVDVPDGPDNWRVRVAGRVTSFEGIPGRYLFITAIAPIPTLRGATDLLAWAIIGFVTICALMVVVVTLLQLQFGMAPLRVLRRDVAAVRKGQAERLEGEYAAEVAPLANELNALLQHNREVVERARRHVGNLAHALKTPIAVLRNAAAEGGVESNVLKSSVAEMESFVERQLRRARVAARAEARAGVEAGALGYRTPVKQNIEDLIFMMEQKYEHEKALDIELVAEMDVTFRGEREDLLEMAANLIDNACKYGKSRIVITVVPPPAPGELMEIVVEDDGPGLTDAQIAVVLERGARLDEAASGQGLGLSILKEAVELYAGELKFERSEALGGLKARLLLPATD